MDATSFDRLARSLSDRTTRRTALRALAGSGVGAGLAALGLRQGALACKENGARCSRKQADACCSGICQKKNGGFRCAKADDAFGCTNEKKTDFCEGKLALCPNNREGACVVDEKRRPLCIRDGACFPCETDQDCNEEYRSSSHRCIKQCAHCAATTGGRFCALPVSAPVGAP